jgi:hypothetical protein
MASCGSVPWAHRTNLLLPCGEAAVIVLGQRDGLGSASRATEQGQRVQQQPRPLAMPAQGLPEAGSHGGDLAQRVGERAVP